MKPLTMTEDREAEIRAGRDVTIHMPNVSDVVREMKRAYGIANDLLGEVEALRARCLAEEQRRREAEAERDRFKSMAIEALEKFGMPHVIRLEPEEAASMIAAERKRREAAEEKRSDLHADVVHRLRERASELESDQIEALAKEIEGWK